MDERSNQHPPIEELISLQSEVLHAALVHGADFWARLDLTMPQLKVLLLLGQQGNATVSWLAGRMHVSPPNVTGILDRLENHTLVRRTSDRQDRRVVRIVLTDEGRDLLSEMEQAGTSPLVEAVRGLNQREQTALREGLRALTAALRGAHHTPQQSSAA